MRNENGFTLIELVMVIVLLGILAAVAIPKFIDLQNEARDASLRGVVGAMGGAMAVNYAARSADSTKGSAVANCTDVTNLLMGGTPSGYTVTPNALVVGTPEDCVVTPTVAGTLATLNFTGIAIN